MAIRLSNRILQFAGSAGTKVYEMFVDYFNHYRAQGGEKGNFEYKTEEVNSEGQLVKISFSEKEDAMNAAIKKEIMRVAQINDMSQFPLEVWATHPSLRFAMFAVVNALVDTVLPTAIMERTELFAEVRNLEWGASAAFDIRPRDLFSISKIGNGKRTTEFHKNFQGQVTLVAEARALTVAVNLMEVLAGKASLGDLASRIIRSMEAEFAYDCYASFKTALDSVDNTASTGLRTAGYTEDEFIRIAQAVQAWNGGAMPIAIGTHRALKSIMPSNDVNYRYDIDSPFVKLGYIREFNGVGTMVLPQIADYNGTTFGVRLANDRIWFVSPSAGKIVKAVIEGATLARTDDTYANSDLSQSTTLTKRWGVGIATSAVAGVLTL
jgi:hypothetical protein